DSLVRLYVARSVGARRSDAKALRAALVQGWLSSPSPAAGAPAGDALAEFAARVLDAAREARTGRYGDNKVFIAHVHRALGGDDTLDHFKARLIDAQRGGLLTLSRA